jgi:hypothetical protein
MGAYQLEARCFRVKSRKSILETLTPSGHHPIPGNGTRVRVYLEKENGSWSVVLPNGITSVEDAGGFPGGNLQDATEVAQLRNRGYTYFLALEHWGCMFVLATLIILAIVLTRWFITRRKTRLLVATEQ